MINLLPREVKERQRALSRAYGVTILYVALIALIGLAIAGLTAYNLVLSAELADKKQALSDLNNQSKKYDQVATKAAFIEDRIGAVENYTENQEWEAVLNQIAAATPADVQLTELQFAGSANGSQTFKLAGHAAERRSIVLYRDKLLTIDGLKSVKITALADSKVNETVRYTFSFELTWGGAK